MNIRRKHIQDLAATLLNEQGVTTAPVDVEAMAKSRNVVIHRGVVDKGISGFLFQDVRKSIAVIGVNQSQHVNRQRFTIAHELGHYLLHTVGDLHLDQNFDVKNRDSRSSQGIDLDEMEANLFAAELLMPTHFLRQDVQSFGGMDFFDEALVGELASKYKVSPQAMVIRLNYLGYLTI